MENVRAWAETKHAAETKAAERIRDMVAALPADANVDALLGVVMAKRAACCNAVASALEAAGRDGLTRDEAQRLSSWALTLRGAQRFLDSRAIEGRA